MTDAKEATHTEPDDIDKITAGVASLTTDSSLAAPVHSTDSTTDVAAPTICNDPSIVPPIPGHKGESHPLGDLDRIKDGESINTHNQAP
ncbi:hypothetical protein BGX21_008558, partial [Mortierella sp. AD011]